MWDCAPCRDATGNHRQSIGSGTTFANADIKTSFHVNKDSLLDRNKTRGMK